MELSEYGLPTAEALRGFVEGVENLNTYFRTNSGRNLTEAEEQLNQSLVADPDFAPAQYYKAVVLTHARKANDAVLLLEELAQREPPFKLEVLYNLTFAYAKTYSYKNVKHGLAAIKTAEELAIEQQRPDMELLVKAMRAWITAVFGGLDLRNPDDFDARKKEHLPAAIDLANSVLKDERLQTVPRETSNTVKVEANNALGIAFMYKGRYSRLFEEDTPTSWASAEHHYRAALRRHPKDVRVIDNLATLELMWASRASSNHQPDDLKKHSETAKKLALEAISYHPHDQFRHRLLARAYTLLGEKTEALRAAEQMRHEPGVFDNEWIDGFKTAITADDLSRILEVPDEKTT